MSDDYYDSITRPIQPDPPLWWAILRMVLLLVGGGILIGVFT